MPTQLPATCSYTRRWRTSSTVSSCLTSPLVEPFRRQRNGGDVFQQRLSCFSTDESKVRVNKHWTSTSTFLFNLSLFFFGYLAQRLCSSTATRFGQNVSSFESTGILLPCGHQPFQSSSRNFQASHWRRRLQHPLFVEKALQHTWLLLFHFVSLIAFGCLTAAAVSDTGLDASLPQVNPLLKHRRESLDFQEQENVCRIWSFKHTPRDLCARSRWSRLSMMREISLFSHDCDTEADNVQLGEFFRIDWQSLQSTSDLVERSEHLKDGIFGRSCILAEANSDECFRCFERVGEGLEIVDHAYQAFDRVLHRFDCGLAVDLASATRPFSPNGTCADCKRWYRKWLLVQLVQVWREPACINWCYYAQLACPHLATIRVVDFAGHPTFLCRDLDIPQQDDEQRRSIDGVASCQCVHPCDLSRKSAKELDQINSARSRQQLPIEYDFFAADEHCAQRQTRCGKERARAAALSDDLDETRLASTSSHRGFVNERANEFYNRLVSDKIFDLTTVSSESLDVNELPFQQRKRKRRRDQDESSSHRPCRIGVSTAIFLVAFSLCLVF